MPLYQVNNRNAAAPAQTNLTTTFKSMIGLNSVTANLRRGKIMEISFGADGAPNATDCAIVYDVSRQTAAGTGGVTNVPTPKDPAEIASVMTSLLNYTGEPTVTAQSSLWMKALNQRASQIWQARDELNALVWPATNLAGLVVRALSPTYASTVLIETVHLE